MAKNKAFHLYQFVSWNSLRYSNLCTIIPRQKDANLEWDAISPELRKNSRKLNKNYDQNVEYISKFNDFFKNIIKTLRWLGKHGVSLSNNRCEAIDVKSHSTFTCRPSVWKKNKPMLRKTDNVNYLWRHRGNWFRNNHHWSSLWFLDQPEIAWICLNSASWKQFTPHQLSQRRAVYSFKYLSVSKFKFVFNTHFLYDSGTLVASRAKKKLVASTFTKSLFAAYSVKF